MALYAVTSKNTEGRKKKSLTDDELRASIDHQVTLALGAENTELTAAREAALDLYLGRPLGNEQEGRSTVVSKDVLDTVEWILPSLLRVFAQKQVVAFEPVGQEDEQAAEQESLYVNHVFMKENRGFMVLYNWFKDALLQKVGYVKHWWEQYETREYECYTDLTLEQLTQVLLDLRNAASDDEEPYEIVGQESRKAVVAGQEMELYDVKLICRKTRGRVCIEGVPPEELLIAPRTRGPIRDSICVTHLVTKTRTELLACGYDEKTVKNLTSYVLPRPDIQDARDTVEEQRSTVSTDDETDSTTEELQLAESFIRLDYDGDGYAELRHVLLAGNEILENEEYDEIPFSDICPVPMPHRHIGLSYADLLEDLQLIKTALLRQLLDNAYLTNNSKKVVNVNNVTLSDLMVDRPGGIIRTSGNPAADVVELVTAPIINRIAPVLDYIDGIKEQRTGVGRITQGLDANVLMNSTKGAFDVATNNAAQRLEAIARIFAETGVKDMFLAVHRMLTKHQDWETQTKLKEQWITINPSTWRDRTDLTIVAGLGNNTRDEIRQNLALMATTQEKAGVAGIVLPKNAYNLALRIQKELGFEAANFFTDPDSPEWKEYMAQQQGGENPLVTAEKIKAQAKLQGDQMKAQSEAANDERQFMLEMQRDMKKMQMEMRQMHQDFALSIAEMELKYKADIAKVGIGAELKARTATASPGRA